MKANTVKAALLSLLYSLLYGKNGACRILSSSWLAMTFCSCEFCLLCHLQSDVTIAELLHSSFAEAQALALCVGISRTTTELTETIALAVGILRNHAGNYRT